jgi:hypothetical protein
MERKEKRKKLRGSNQGFSGGILLLNFFREDGRSDIPANWVFIRILGFFSSPHTGLKGAGYKSLTVRCESENGVSSGKWLL